jgi:hypothetical protein
VKKPDDDLNWDEIRRMSATRGLPNPDFEENEPRWGTAHFSARMNLLVYVRGAQEPLIFDAQTIDELVIGRYDPDNDFNPDINLDPYGAADKGVSRRHAVILRRDGSLNIVDAGSHNGTYLNGQRLVPHQPRILRDSDDLRLGHLVLHIKFVRA